MLVCVASRFFVFFMFLCFFFFNDTATTEIYTLSLHDALPIFLPLLRRAQWGLHDPRSTIRGAQPFHREVERGRSEEHTSELQSRPHLVCRLLLEKKTRVGRERVVGERSRVRE